VTADPAQARDWQESFGRRVRTLRTRAGLSQMAFADRVGLHPTYISGIERGERNVSLVNIRLIAAGLDVQAGDLFEQ
jgi:transcriptional regulator with XRE-family HTH domain